VEAESCGTPPPAPAGTIQAALVTGGSKGIGYACAERLSGDGYAVMICARDGAEVEAAAAALRGAGAPLVGVRADLAPAEDCERIVERCVDEFGRIDALVNNAAIYSPCHFLDVTAEHWDETLVVDLRAPAFVSVAAARHMRQVEAGPFTSPPGARSLPSRSTQPTALRRPGWSRWRGRLPPISPSTAS